MKKLLVVLVLALAMMGCTQNQRAKSFGGTATINLPKDTKLVTVTWKGEELWYLVRKRGENEKVERYEFIEDSSFGVMEGKVVLKEN